MIIHPITIRPNTPFGKDYRGAGKVIVAFDSEGVVAGFAYIERAYVTEGQAIAAAGKSRWCPAAKRQMSRMIAEERKKAIAAAEASLLERFPVAALVRGTASCYQIVLVRP